MRTSVDPASPIARALAALSRARAKTRPRAALVCVLLAVSAAPGSAGLAAAATPQAIAGAPAGPAARKPEPVAESLPGVVVDWERGQLLSPGSCAADLYAASADVARTKAERLARLRAEERLRKALAILDKDKGKDHKKRLAALGAPAQLTELDPARARVAAIEYGANGSVSLRLALDLRPAPAPAAAGTPTDAGAPAAPPDAGPPAPAPSQAAAPPAPGTDGR